MRVIYYQNRQVSVPETLEELTPAQYYRYLEIATMANQHILSEPRIRLKILSLFLALPVDMGHLPPSTWKETLALLSLTDPFVIREGKSFRLDLSTGINLLPEWNGFHGPEDMLNGVSFDTFCKCDFRAVKVKACSAVHKSKKLLQFTLDDGTGTDRTILSGIKAYYEPEELIGKTCVAIVNLPPRKMMGIESCGMLLSAEHMEGEERKLHLLMLDPHIPAGAKLC